MTHFTAPFDVVDTSGNNLFSVGANGLSTKGTEQVVKIARITGGSTAEVDTGVVIPSNAIIYDVFLNVITPEVSGSVKTVSVGLLSSQTGGNASGFLNNISVANAGIVRGVATLGSGNSYYAATTLGSFLAGFYAGSGTSYGLNYERPFLSSSVAAKNVSYKRASSMTELQADIYIRYLAI